MVWVPAGRSLWGPWTSTRGGAGPPGPVEGLWVDLAPVSNAEFAAFVADTGYVTTAEQPLDPKVFPDLDDYSAGSMVFRPTGGRSICATGQVVAPDHPARLGVDCVLFEVRLMSVVRESDDEEPAGLRRDKGTAGTVPQPHSGRTRDGTGDQRSTQVCDRCGDQSGADHRGDPDAVLDPGDGERADVPARLGVNLIAKGIPPLT